MYGTVLLYLLFTWWTVFYLSGVNLKVHVHASGPDRINVLPPIKGTVYLQSIACVCAASGLFCVIKCRRQPFPIQIQPRQKAAVLKQKLSGSTRLDIIIKTHGGHSVALQCGSSTTHLLSLSVWRTKWSTCTATRPSGSGSSTSLLLCQVSALFWIYTVLGHVCPSLSNFHLFHLPQS